jgi:hypothetical protein
MSEPETQRALHGRFRASRADRERVIEALKAGFVQGRLTKDELEARTARALVARTYADLAVVTADIPAPAAPSRRPAARPSGLPMSTAISVGALVIVVDHLVLLAAVLSGNSGAMTLAAVLLFTALIATLGAIIISD